MRSMSFVQQKRQPTPHLHAIIGTPPLVPVPKNSTEKSDMLWIEEDTFKEIKLLLPDSLQVLLSAPQKVFCFRCWYDLVLSAIQTIDRSTCWCVPPSEEIYSTLPLSSTQEYNSHFETYLFHIGEYSQPPIWSSLFFLVLKEWTLTSWKRFSQIYWMEQRDNLRGAISCKHFESILWIIIFHCLPVILIIGTIISSIEIPPCWKLFLYKAA